MPEFYWVCEETIMRSRFLAVAVVATAMLTAQQMSVHAPYAQALVEKIMSHHHEVHKIGIHATPPNSSDNVIIAANIPAKIGKKSSAKDMELVATGKPQSTKVDKDSIYDLLLPLSDTTGKQVGFVVMEIPFTQSKDKDEALEKGLAVRDEMQKQIKSKEQLFQ
jgi:hypothetical protein